MNLGGGRDRIDTSASPSGSRVEVWLGKGSDEVIGGPGSEWVHAGGLAGSEDDEDMISTAGGRDFVDGAVHQAPLACTSSSTVEGLRNPGENTFDSGVCTPNADGTGGTATYEIMTSGTITGFAEIHDRDNGQTTYSNLVIGGTRINF